MNRQEGHVAVLIVLAAVATFNSILVGDQTIEKYILVGWLVGPPVYFFFEYLQAENDLREVEGAMERFKDLQRLASAIWAGVAAALGVVFFK